MSKTGQPQTLTENPSAVVDDAGASSTAAQALEAAGDAEQARDVAALDDSALAAQARLGTVRPSLVQRLIYGPRPATSELASGTRIGNALSPAGRAVVEAALDCMARGEAFEANTKLSAELRRAVAEEKAYGFTVPADFGGAGGNYGQLALAEEALAANGLGALAVEISGELTIGAGSLLGYGTDEQKKTYLPMLSEGRLMAFALTEVGVGVNAKKVQAYVELDEDASCWRLHGDGPRAKMYITNATHGAIAGLVARIGKGGKKVGLFVVELPEKDLVRGEGQDYGFRCTSTEVSAFMSTTTPSWSSTTSPFRRRIRFRRMASRCCSTACAWVAACSRRCPRATSACSPRTRCTLPACATASVDGSSSTSCRDWVLEKWSAARCRRVRSRTCRCSRTRTESTWPDCGT